MLKELLFIEIEIKESTAFVVLLTQISVRENEEQKKPTECVMYDLVFEECFISTQLFQVILLIK